MNSISNSIKPLDLVLVSGITSEPVVCIVSPGGKEIIISTSTPLSNALVDDRILHSNLGSLIQLVGEDTGVYYEIIQSHCDTSNINSSQATKDCLLLARAFNYIKLNYDIKSLTCEASFKDVVRESLLYANEVQQNIEKAHYAIIKLTTPSLKNKQMVM